MAIIMMIDPGSCEVCGNNDARPVDDDDGSYIYCDHCFQLVYGRI